MLGCLWFYVDVTEVLYAYSVKVLYSKFWLKSLYIVVFCMRLSGNYSAVIVVCLKVVPIKKFCRTYVTLRLFCYQSKNTLTLSPP